MSGRAEAEARDARDPLARFRARFYVRSGTIYLDGNSLGLASRDAEAAVLGALDAWQESGIEGWLAGGAPGSGSARSWARSRPSWSARAPPKSSSPARRR